ncbi:MAG: glycoside hydrolase family 3 C-terminal domain-containing protein [Bacteroidales bacterium]|nr:glycoside hydrolase family 3 C-terminal domain-containing protein [Bacteroidales bacterium]MBN2818689.1 glycoside hydrolase family 3 C-terminal domain-containing protein [Bacteroidales bacterium]
MTNLLSCKNENTNPESVAFDSYIPPVSWEEADAKAEALLAGMTVEEKIDYIGGHNYFFVKGNEEYNIPRLYLSDATQGVHIRKNLDGQLEKSTAFPCPISLTSTWNTELARKYATSIGEECRAGDIAVLLGPGMNLYRVSQNGRNFEYFGEDPYLAARMVENYVVGVQSTGTIATLKHFICNNTDFRRRTSNSVVGERALNELYLPAFKAGVDAGALAVMTAYNQVNGEWAGQSEYVINNILRKQLGFKWLVMTDWWSIWDPVKTIKSGQDLDMPGHGFEENLPTFANQPNPFLRYNAKRLVDEGKVKEEDIHRMAKSVLRVSFAMGLDKRPVKDTTLLAKFPEHKEIALQTAREGIVLLRNENNILPIDKSKSPKILLTGMFAEKVPMGGGSAEVEGYDNITMLQALQDEFGDLLSYEKEPDDNQITSADIVIVSIGTSDSEGYDSPFELPKEVDDMILNVASKNSNVIVVVNSGRGVGMTKWNNMISGLIYSWYPGQTGNVALAEILSGKTNPSAKLPISIEKKFEDSPGYPYMPEGEDFYTGWDTDFDMSLPIYDIIYDEGVFTGYRWFEKKEIEPLYPFGFGLSYTIFDYNKMKISASKIASGDLVTVECEITNSGKKAGAEIVQLYVSDQEASVPRPVKELKGFKKVTLNPGESKSVSFVLDKSAFSFWDEESKNWKLEPGNFLIHLATSSVNIKETLELEIQ